MGNFSQPFSGAQAELAFGGDIASGSPNKIAVQRVQEWLCYRLAVSVVAILISWVIVRDLWGTRPPPK